MFQQIMVVRYLTLKTCFGCVSSTVFKQLTSNTIKVCNDNKSFYFSIEGTDQALDEHDFGLNSLYARCLGLREGDTVSVTEVAKTGIISRVTVLALSNDDYIILEMLAESVQSTLLNQVRVLNNEQKLIIWVGNTISVTVNVSDIQPKSPGRIDNLTEVTVKPPYKEKSPKFENPTKKMSDTIENFFDSLYHQEHVMILRMLPAHEAIGHIYGVFDVFVLTRSESLKSDPSQIYSVQLIDHETNLTDKKVIFVTVHILPSTKFGDVFNDSVFVSETVFEYFNSSIGSRLLIQPITSITQLVTKIEIYTKETFSMNAEKMFREFLASSCCNNEVVVLNSDVLMSVAKEFKCFLRFQPPQALYCVINQDLVRDCELSVISENVLQPGAYVKSEDVEFCTEVANYREIVGKCLSLFTRDAKSHRSLNNVLLTGKTGTGKSTLLLIAESSFKKFPFWIYSKTITCKSIKGKTVESLQRIFGTVLLELIHHQPSILILDDLHVLCENVNEQGILSPNALHSNGVSEMLQALFNTFCKDNAVAIFASAKSTSSLNKNIYGTRGNHMFKDVFSIDNLGKIEKRTMLEFLLRNYGIHNLDFNNLAETTESFVVQDLVDFANKVGFEALQDHDVAKQELEINMSHCKNVLNSLTISSLHGINQYHPGIKDLSDIGGLGQAKNVLIETMMWPSKHLGLFSNAPLRLPSGLLLYGPPGTGKTILAGAAAKHCGLRLISIKGPELLSKYIGASEQAVRDVFQRAQSARPCVLFFDEFDSLAPRRGHDNTGVTDRVVNQLLTQLDGVETLNGVFVLAATSRPDLLDPALLRPGRLDRHIVCPLPDQKSRHDILKALSKCLTFGPDVDLEDLAKRTDGFSGADLQAILYSAQLDSVKEMLDDDETSDQQPQIEQRRLLEAVKSTRPSLSRTEQRKYEKIYRKFEGGGEEPFVPGIRATLA